MCVNYTTPRPKESILHIKIAGYYFHEYRTEKAVRIDYYRLQLR